MRERTMRVAHTLAPHVRMCTVDGHDIVLDLLSNRYAAISIPTNGSAASHATAWSPAMSDALIRRGWVVEHVSPRPPGHPAPLEAPEPTETLFPDGGHRAHAGCAGLGACILAASRAAWWLRHRTLHAIAASLHERRVRLDGHEPDDVAARLPAAVGRYLCARPLVLTSRDRCLHDSLTLVDLLLRARIGAHWVIGVRTRPFAAHAWAQHGPVVLNDQHERVRAFQPILVA